MTMPRSFSWAMVPTAMVVAIIVVLVSSLFTGPSTSSVKDGYLAADSVLFSNGQKTIGDSLKNVHSNLKRLDSELGDKLTYESAYGLLDGESKKTIPSFIQMIELEIDSTGAVDTTNSYTELVPPVLNWRYWKEMEHVPTEVFASDTTKNAEEVTVIRKYFQPTFSTVSKKPDVKKDAKEKATPTGKINF